MSDALCFRCDWQGRTSKVGCPSCGAPLYRPQERATVAPREAAPSGRADSEAGPFLEQEAAGRGTTPWRILAAMAVFGLLAAAVWTRIPGDRARSQGRPEERRAVLRGTLVYVARQGSGGSALWSLDLATGRTTRGAEIPEPRELVDASRVGTGWLGMTVASRDGSERALLLADTARDARPVLLGTGDLVAWGPGGRSVAIAKTRRRRDGCRRSLHIAVAWTKTGAHERILGGNGSCGDILSLGRDGAETYFTQMTGRGVRVRSCGTTCVPRPMLKDYTMVSVSPVSDFLVTPTRNLAAGEVVSNGVRPVFVPGTSLAAGTTLVPGTLLYWRGRGGPVPLGDDADALVVERALAWSSDGSRVLVTGRLGVSTGVFLVSAGPGSDPVRRAPTFVVRTDGPAWATFSEDGTAFLALGGRLVAYGDGGLADVPLPEGAPEPTGPIAWTP